MYLNVIFDVYLSRVINAGVGNHEMSAHISELPAQFFSFFKAWPCNSGTLTHQADFKKPALLKIDGHIDHL